MHVLELLDEEGKVKLSMSHLASSRQAGKDTLASDHPQKGAMLLELKEQGIMYLGYLQIIKQAKK